MAPPPLTPTIRYFAPGLRKTYWLPTTANYQQPSRAEINAGTDISAEIATATGWSLTSAKVETPDLGSRFVTQIPGRLTSDSNEFECYVSQDGDDIRRLLPLNTNGFVVQLWEGAVAGQYMDVFPVRVMSAAMVSGIEDPGKVTVQFAATEVPAIQIAIPA